MILIIFKIYVILLTFKSVFSVPINLPFWYQPCGSKIEPDNYNLNNIEHEIKSNLNRMKLQHNIALGSFKIGNYENVYDKASNHIARKQYIPHWIPNEFDISLIKQLEGKTLKTVNKLLFLLFLISKIITYFFFN